MHCPPQQLVPLVHAATEPQTQALLLQPSDVDAEQVFGQFTVVPQLLTADPHDFPLHVMAVLCGVHPHPLAPAPPPPHVLGGVQVFGQVMFCPQLLVAAPHALPLQAVVLLGVQQLPFAMQTPALGQVAGQVTLCPQLLVTVTLHLPAQATVLSGVQQVPLAMQTSELEAHDPLDPQVTVCPQLLVAVPHDLFLQVVPIGSGEHPQAPFVHVAPPSQPPQSTV
jgi:hypothetical protein